MKPLSTTADVRAEYASRLQSHSATRDDASRQENALANGRLYVVLAGGVLAWLAFGRGLFSPWWLAVPVAVFLVLVVRHGRARTRLDRAQRLVAFYEAGLARVEGRWAGRGVAGARFADAQHPYAEDLDLFGRGSLFELLCTARTRAGEDCLAGWLLAPAGRESVSARQQAVRELTPRLDLREDLALRGADVRASVDPEALAAWGTEPPRLTSRGQRVAAATLALLTVAALLGWGLGTGSLPFYVLVAVGQAFAWRLRRPVRAVVRGVDRPARDLTLLSELLSRLEREAFDSPLLRQMQAALHDGGPDPSVRITRLRTLTEYLEAAHNQLFAPVAAVLLWTIQFAFALEQWRLQNGPQLSVWLRTVGEFEALCALSGYAFEHPEDVFPEIVSPEIVFEAEGLSHPLLPAAVPNDVSLGGATRLYVVSGSNMSGKSTLLRAVGISTLLALAGAPVRARRLRLSPLHVGASLRTQDSLQGGVSRFYAEITRLRRIVDIVRDHPPCLFLLDEILHGTNSHDRRVGAEAVARALLASGGIGLITTHDLALARLADDAAQAVANVHFEDQMENGRMTFDYHLRPGVVEKSNALELMRAVGLDV